MPLTPLDFTAEMLCLSLIAIYLLLSPWHFNAYLSKLLCFLRPKEYAERPSYSEAEQGFTLKYKDTNPARAYFDGIHKKEPALAEHPDG